MNQKLQCKIDKTKTHKMACTNLASSAETIKTKHQTPKIETTHETDKEDELFAQE